MSENHEHIYQLLLQKRNGTINESDDQYVSGLINGHEDVELMWRALKHSFSLPGEEKFWQQIDVTNAWTSVRQELSVKNTNIRSIRQWLFAAAVATVALTGISLIWKSTHRSQQLAAVPPTKKPAALKAGLQLQLAGGETIDLPYNQAGQDIKAGDVKLSAGAKKLQYSGGSAMGTGYNTLTVPPKMDYKLVLSDGTEVWLNATSRLRFPFSFTGDKREVYLDGEGYFQVTRNDAKPFIVHTAKTDIQVLGTSFNVNAYTDGLTRTSLVSGAVISRAAGDEVKLKPGEEAVYSSDKGYKVATFDDSEVLAWMKGVYVFHNTSLSEIASVIDRWYGVKVVFDNKELAGKKFTGGLEKLQKLDYFLETLDLIASIKHSYDANGVLHLK
ncbi:FecR family protein [Chitinophaga rhizophila]|uniref:FecR domain-containing protein n=1 Tax=Chitinophaga rhizophila TaxID=2866212 RepID=A0ABS7GHE0_9BACT|nr:FecR domain-containing protein [Chitinophaga rhizophila]MBW8686841.1 FecR domain-containing protein [Chitinophaga rhizophila]